MTEAETGHEDTGEDAGADTGVDTGAETAPQASLAERVETLRAENKPVQQIARAIFLENLDANVGELSQLLGMKILDVGRIKGNVSRWKKQQGRTPAGTKEETAEKEPTTEPTESTSPEREGISVYKQEPDPNGILDGILSKHPDITSKIRAEIMDWARMKGILDPQSVAYLLSNMRGVAPNTANIVANKYSLALQKAQLEGKSQQFSMGGMMGPYYLQNPLGMGNAQSGPQDLRAEMKEERAEMREEMRRLREDLKPKEQQPEQLIEIEEPLRGSDGAVVTGKDGLPLVKRMRVPFSMAGRFAPTEDAEERVLRRMKLQRELFKPDSPPVTAENINEQIRRIMREEKERPETPSLTKEDISRATREAADEAVKNYAGQAEKEKKEDERFARLETAIKEAGSSRSADGYTQDGYRFMSEGIKEASKTLKEVVDRKPLEALLDRGEKLLFSGGPAPPKDLEANNATLDEKFYDRLAKQGMVSEH